jgi:hypothetical protein
VPDIIEKVLSYYAILSAIQNYSSNRIQNSKTSSSSKIVNRSRFSKIEKFCIHHVSWDVIISNRCLAVDQWKRYLFECDGERRSFVFNILLITNNSQQKNSIFIDILKNLIFWITNDSVRVLKIIQQIKDETKKMTKKYNEQCDLIDELSKNHYVIV